MDSLSARALQPLLQSAEGLHLTSYIQGGHYTSLKQGLYETLEVAPEYLGDKLKPEEIQKFLEPIANMVNETTLLKKIRGNLGLFRTQSSIRLLSIPIEVDPITVVAGSFHVKPLLKWIQTDREFLLLGVDGKVISLYHGSLGFFHHVDTIVMANTQLVHEWLERFQFPVKTKLFLTGNGRWVDDLAKQMRERGRMPVVLSAPFSPPQALDFCLEARSILRMEVRRKLDGALMEFYEAEEAHSAKRNIFEIAKAAVMGRVKKLIVADGIRIFGHLDKKSGGLSIHPAQLNHEDDDLLDDLAQAVLNAGGEVVVADLDAMPKRRPVLAIVERPINKRSYVGRV